MHSGAKGRPYDVITMSSQHQGDVLKTSLTPITDHLPTSQGLQVWKRLKAVAHRTIKLNYQEDYEPIWYTYQQHGDNV